MAYTQQDLDNFARYQDFQRTDGGRGTMANARKGLQGLAAQGFDATKAQQLQNDPSFMAAFQQAYPTRSASFFGGLLDNTKEALSEQGLRELALAVGGGMALGATPAAGVGGAGGASVGAGGLTAVPAGGMTATGAIGAGGSGGGLMSLPAGGMTATGAGGAMSPLASSIAASEAAAGGYSLAPTALTGSSAGGGLFGLSSGQGALLGAGTNLLGGYLQGSQAKDAAAQSAAAQIEAARIAAEAAKFKPVGVTSRFGTSQFGYDANGNLVSAGYEMDPALKAQQDTLMGMSPGLLDQYKGAQAATAPMGDTAQRAMQLGQGYLATTPQEQAAKYMADQQALLAPSRANQYSALQNQLARTGRSGLSIGGDAGMLAANPEMSAYYNALAQQDLGLAAQATQGGQQYAQFGTQLSGTGGDLLKQMYGTQTAAYDPWQQSIGGASYLEGLAQQPMDLGINIGAKGTAASAQSGMLMANGMTNAANTMQPANAWSPWGDALQGAGNALTNYKWGK